MLKIQIDRENLVIVLIGICFSQIIFESLGMTNLTSILFYLSFIVLFFAWIIGGFDISDTLDKSIFLMFILCILNVSLNILISGGAFSFDVIKKVLFLISTLIAYRVSLYKMDGMRIEKWFSRFVFISSVVFIFLYYTRNAEMHLYHEMVSKYLTFNLENPNKAGLFLFILAVSNLILSFRNVKLFRKIAFLALTVVFVLFIVETKSRNSLIAFFIFSILFLYVVLKAKKGIVVSKSFNFLIVIFPLAFTIIYLSIIDDAIIYNIFGFLSDEGKGLDSRLDIWMNAYAVLKNNFVFGAYSQLAATSSGTFQLHNTHIDVLCAFGIVPFIMFVRYLFIVLNKLSNEGQIEKYNLVYYFAFVATIFLGTFEAAVYNGGNGIGMLAATFVLFSHNLREEKEYGQVEFR